MGTRSSEDKNSGRAAEPGTAAQGCKAQGALPLVLGPLPVVAPRRGGLGGSMALQDFVAEPRLKLNMPGGMRERGGRSWDACC